MRPYIAHLMADLLKDPTIAIAHPGYVAIVLAAYGRETGGGGMAVKMRKPYGAALVHRRRAA